MSLCLHSYETINNSIEMVIADSPGTQQPLVHVNVESDDEGMTYSLTVESFMGMG